MKTIKRIVTLAITACMLCFLSGIEVFAEEQIPLNEASVSVEVPVVRIRGEVLASSLPDNCFAMLTGPTTMILDADKMISGISYYLPDDYYEEDFWFNVIDGEHFTDAILSSEWATYTFDTTHIDLAGSTWGTYATLTIVGSGTLTVEGGISLATLNRGPDPVGTLIVKSGTLILPQGASAETLRVEGGTIRCAGLETELIFWENRFELNLFGKDHGASSVIAARNYEPTTQYTSGLTAIDFFMSGGELEISGNRYGICADSIDISNGKIDVIAEDTGFTHYQAAYGNGNFFTCNVNITGGMINVQAMNNDWGIGINANTFTMTGGTLDASGGKYAVSCWGDSVVLGNDVGIQSPNGAYAPQEKSEETGYSILNEDGTPATRVLIAPLDSNANDDEISVIVNGKATGWTDATPFIDENNRTMVPLRAVGDALGLTVDWDNEAREAVFTDGAKTIYFPIGSKTARTSEGSSIEMDTAAIIVNERTYAPIRYLAEFFDCSVDWDGATRSVILKTSGQDDESGLWTFRYDSNGADGAEIILPLSVPDGHVRVVRGNEIYKTGYAFNGWNTMPDGSGDTYAIYDEITIHKNIILYAQWKPIPPYGTNGPHPATYEELKAALLSDAEWIYVDADITYDGPANGELRVRGNKFLCIDKDATIITTENFAIDQIGSTLAVREAGGKLIAANVSVPW